MFKKIGQFFRSMVLVLMIVSQPFAALGVSAAQGSDFVKQAGQSFGCMAGCSVSLVQTITI